MRWYEAKYKPDSLRTATRSEEARSIDLVARKGDQQRTIEVKTEFAAAKSGNVVFEVVSQARIGQNGALGWGFKLEDTNYIAYLIPGPDKVYVFRATVIQEFALEHYSRLRNFVSPNRGYKTLGVLMPLKEVAPYCLMFDVLPQTEETEDKDAL